MSNVPLRRRIGDVLVEAGLISAEQLNQALEVQREPSGPRRRLGQVVVDMGIATEKQVAECIAQLLNLEMIDLSRLMPAPDVVRTLPRQVAERTRVLVLDRTPTGLVIATADPTNVLALDDVRLYTRSSDLTVKVATESQIRDQLNRAWALGSDNANVAALVDEQEELEVTDTNSGGADEDAPIVKLVSQILGDAVRLRVSDIHIEVQRDVLRVRYRIDGLLRDVMTAPKRISTAVISRIKIISGLDIAERRVPQDGRARFMVEDIAIDARISTLPSLHGEKVVIRLLSRGDAIPKLMGLGFEPEQLQIFENSLATPQGLILITGPTGSGKTNTLYSAIAEIQNPDVNIVTLEDPIEVQLPGITQVGVNEKTGMTFTAGLRSILRQDPDIILVGEVRDTETAQLALKASLTGHMVLTTLHTNSAAAALTRLVDMGCEPFLVASSLTCAIAQRLVRRPCGACAEPYTPNADTLALLGLSPADLAGSTPQRGVGCPECGNTGYQGRTAVYEVLEVDGPMRRVLMREPTETAVENQARASGMSTLRASAINKAKRGLTTFEEALRVTHSDHEDMLCCMACERPVEDDMVACPWCGVSLEHDKCPDCHKKVDSDWKTCPWCRHALAKDGTAQPSTPSATPAVAATTTPASATGWTEPRPTTTNPLEQTPTEPRPTTTNPLEHVRIDPTPARAVSHTERAPDPATTAPSALPLREPATAPAPPTISAELADTAETPVPPAPRQPASSTAPSPLMAPSAAPPLSPPTSALRQPTPPAPVLQRPENSGDQLTTTGNRADGPDSGRSEPTRQPTGPARLGTRTPHQPPPAVPARSTTPGLPRPPIPAGAPASSGPPRLVTNSTPPPPPSGRRNLPPVPPSGGAATGPARFNRPTPSGEHPLPPPTEGETRTVAPPPGHRPPPPQPPGN